MTGPGLMVRPASTGTRPGADYRSWPCCFWAPSKQGGVKQVVSALRYQRSVSRCPGMGCMQGSQPERVPPGRMEWGKPRQRRGRSWYGQWSGWQADSIPACWVFRRYYK